ncbi:FtsK/SpoIIIE family DNA translocase [Desnuesiella massiliensis]|uniref:FtsK/SpoIIIE family DNA translocase n=1 Tax=Desnuesiella massiliensis TaxID=1650662 RepID=UPI0006E253E2|nr:DNA translocase FtsK [Desnuesiella massiliensis]
MGRSKKTKNNLSYNNEIIGVILITFGILIGISVYSKSNAILFSFLRRIIISLVGVGAFFVPFIIIFLGTLYIANKKLSKLNTRFYGLVLLAVISVLFIQIITIEDFYNGILLDALKNIVNSNEVMHGGILFLLIDIPLYKLLGAAGSIIVFISLLIIALMMIFKFSLYDFGLAIKSLITTDIPKRKKIVEEKPQLANVPQEFSLVEESSAAKDKDNFIKGLNSKIKILDFMRESALEQDTNADNKDTIVESNNKKNTSLDNEVKEMINKELSQKIEEKNSYNDCEYIFPSTELLNPNMALKMNKEDKKDLLNNANKLEETLSSFGVEAKVIQVTKGPSVTRFELQPNAGVKVSKIVNLSDDIALSLASNGVRIEAPIPGKSAVGIEVPNRDLMPVFLREVLDSEEFKNSNKNLAFSLGKDISGNCVVSDLTKMPHLLIAGATGSGKSVCINTLIISLLFKYSPDNVKLLMIDPKVVELNVYNGIPHLLIPVVTDPKKAAAALNWAVNEMTRRYKLFADNGVRNIEGFNELFNKGKIQEKLPWIVIIVDELADLMMVCPHDVEDYIGRLAQMARAAGMHLVIATQRPSVDVITGVIKANIPSRISFAVSSQVDSRTILDSSGAEKLLGKGDMLFYPVGESKPLRVQGAFISEEEVERVVSFIKNQKGEINYESQIIEHINNEASDSTDTDEEDELLEEAIKIVVECGQASTSLIQRRLRIGYNRAARIMEQLEERRIISPKDGSKPRQILVSKEEI